MIDMKRFICSAIAVCTLSAAAAQAESIPSGKAAELNGPSWALQVTPYMWAAGINGDISPFRRAPTVAIKKPFREIMDELNFGGFIDVWGRYDRFLISGDIMYVNTIDSRAIGTIPGFGPTPGLGVSVDTRQLTATVKAGYRLYSSPDFTFDLLAGGRFWQITNDIKIKYAALSPTYGERFSWADPVIGARAFYQFNEKFSAQVQADIGGFGVGSRQTWQALATLNYAFTDHLSASAGYKILHVNYDAGGYVFDTTLKGPVLGLTWRF